MKESKSKRPVFVGVFIFVGIALLVAGILVIGDLHTTFTSKLEVTTFFDDVNGLQKGNNIWFSGVKIGTIKRVDLNGHQVKVVMNIDEKVQSYVRKDAKVKVSTDGLIGNKILVIYGGTANAEQISAGDTLSVEKTFSTEDMINMLQENNKNVLAITTDFKVVSKGLAEGQGTIGKLLKSDSIYNSIAATGNSLQKASQRAEQLISSLSTFSNGLNKKGTLANQLVTDTVVFNSLKQSVLELHTIADTASLFIANLNTASRNPKSPVGVLLRDEETGANLKSTIKNLNSGSKKLDQDLEALQHNILLRRYFKKEAKDSINTGK